MSSRESARPGFLASTLAVARKELLAGFRDRQTTLYTLVLPIVLYPFLFWCMIQGSLFVEGRREHTEVRVGIAAARAGIEPEGLAAALERSKPRTSSEESEPLNRLRVLPPRAPLPESEARTWVAPGARRSTAEASDPDAVLYLAADDGGERAGAEILYDSSSPKSQIALARLQGRMPAFVKELRERSAAASGRDEPALDPFRREASRDVAPPKALGAYLLSFILPLLFVIMAVIGAFFPAVDMTCGERERRTAETTMLLPIPRNAVHLGKILAVCVAAILATTLNISALGLSAEHLLRMLPSRGTAVSVDLPVRAFFQAAPLLLLFAFFVSSILTGVASLARTFKEGQALLGPVQILFVVPAMAGTLPGVELTPALAGIPVVNVVLCFKSLLRGESIAVPYAITAASLVGLSVAAIALSVWTLSRESQIAGEGGTAWSRFRGLFSSAQGAR